MKLLKILTYGSLFVGGVATRQSISYYKSNDIYMSVFIGFLALMCIKTAIDNIKFIKNNED